MAYALEPIDQLEILTLQDNYIDIAVMDDTDIIQRARPAENGVVRNSILAEHGFSAFITLKSMDRSHDLLMDFGFSHAGAAMNADALQCDLRRVETMVLSHGHMDHFGGLAALAERIGKPGLELVLHPSAFRQNRYIKADAAPRIGLPSLQREMLTAAGVTAVESAGPRMLLDGTLLFLGEIPRRTDFEKGFPRMCYDDNGREKKDPIEDDTAIALHVRDKGLAVISGCAHSGIVNTLYYARELTGIDSIFLVMGGFHLTGKDFEPVIAPTINALKALQPTYVVPTHCTGRKATQRIEAEMPQQFLLNMSGTRMTFKA